MDFAVFFAVLEETGNDVPNDWTLLLRPVGVKRRERPFTVIGYQSMPLGILVNVGDHAAKIPRIGDRFSLERVLKQTARAMINAVDGFAVRVEKIGEMAAGSMEQTVFFFRRENRHCIGDLRSGADFYKEVEVISKTTESPRFGDRRNVLTV